MNKAADKSVLVYVAYLVAKSNLGYLYKLKRGKKS